MLRIPPTPVQNLINTKLDLLCQVSGFPLPNVTWLKNDSLIQNGSRYTNKNYYNKLPNNINTFMLVQTEIPVVFSILQIKELKREDTSNYSCNARNFLEEKGQVIAEKNFSIIVFGKLSFNCFVCQLISLCTVLE